MGIRESLNQNPNVTTGLTALIIIIAVAVIVWQLRGGNRPVTTAAERAFFTVDDGKSTFIDDAAKLPPFDVQGKTAYRAYVFACSNGKIRFVGYLERYTPEGKSKLEAARSHKQQVDPSFAESVMQTGMEVKPPLTGDAGWILRGDPKSAPVLNPKCPDGSNDLEPVSP